VLQSTGPSGESKHANALQHAIIETRNFMGLLLYDIRHDTAFLYVAHNGQRVSLI